MEHLRNVRFHPMFRSLILVACAVGAGYSPEWFASRSQVLREQYYYRDNNADIRPGKFEHL